MLNSSLQQLSAALRSKKISSVELTQLYLARIAALNPKLNAYITVNPDMSLAQAREADAMLASGNAQPLTGIPIAQKDIFCAKGWRTTCGSKMLHNFVSPYDAHVISQFNNAGAVNLGKTNMDEFAMGSSNETSYFGAVHNLLDRARVPGGSSGGTAAAVAARLCAAATGTDTGGSIPARRVVRRLRFETYLRGGIALWHDRLRLQPGSGRADGAQCGRFGAAA